MDKQPWMLSLSCSCSYLLSFENEILKIHGEHSEDRSNSHVLAAGLKHDTATLMAVEPATTKHLL